MGDLCFCAICFCVTWAEVSVPLYECTYAVGLSHSIVDMRRINSVKLLIMNEILGSYTMQKCKSEHV